MTPPRGAKSKTPGPIPVEMIRHNDKRANIPTNELRGFVDEDEKRPKPTLYPRDRALDPQLVWRGKDEQDAEHLEVPTVPIYIQEKVQPRVLIENLRQTAAAGQPEPELSLFDDFNGIEFEELVDFYQHEQNWSNRLILGDSLLVMTSLAEKEGLRGKVQTIFVDPPYGISFGSNWQVSTQDRQVRDGKLDQVSRQPEQIRAFRDTWQDGIHSYLAYLRDRLTVARELLAESGSVFVQIGDENVHLVRSLLDEVFGAENFVSLISFRKTGGATAEMLAGTTDYVIWYAKERGSAKYRPIYRERQIGGLGGGAYTRVLLPNGDRRSLTSDELDDLSSLPAGAKPYRLQTLVSPRIRESRTGIFPFKLGEVEYQPRAGVWKTNEAGMERLRLAERLEGTRRTLNYVRFHDDFPVFPLTNFWEDTQVGQRHGQGLRRPDEHENRRAVPPHDDRSRRPRTRPHERQWDNRCCRGGMGSPLDCDRHLSRRRGPHAHAFGRSQAALLPARRFAVWSPQRRGAHGSPLDANFIRQRSSQGLCLPARPTHHAARHRAEPRPPRRHVAV